jgi:hypothetical protein
MSRTYRQLSRLSVLRAASMLMLAGSVLVAMPNPAAAAGPDTPLRVECPKIVCLDEDGDGFLNFHNEAYLVVFAADISGPVVRARTFRSPIINDVDSGETKFLNPPLQLWDFDGTGSPIANPDNLIFLGAMMESDENSARADAVRNTVQSQLFANLVAYKAGGLSRVSIISHLIFDMNVAIDQARDDDDRIGGVRELRWFASDVINARNGIQVRKVLAHVKTGASYQSHYTMD